MDIKEQISKMVEKITKDDKLRQQFQKEPAKAVEKVLGVDLPDELVEKIITGVKGKLTVDKLSDAAGFLKKML